MDIQVAFHSVYNWADNKFNKRIYEHTVYPTGTSTTTVTEYTV